MKDKHENRGLPKKADLSRDEWDFSETRVTESELEVCLFYEYARESLSIRQILEDSFSDKVPGNVKGKKTCALVSNCPIRNNLRRHALPVLMAFEPALIGWESCVFSHVTLL